MVLLFGGTADPAPGDALVTGAGGTARAPLNNRSLPSPLLPPLPPPIPPLDVPSAPPAVGVATRLCVDDVRARAIAASAAAAAALEVGVFEPAPLLPVASIMAEEKEPVASKREPCAAARVRA